jgi:tetratricopeptide (TPR) repeat protein
MQPLQAIPGPGANRSGQALPSRSVRPDAGERPQPPGTPSPPPPPGTPPGTPIASIARAARPAAVRPAVPPAAGQGPATRPLTGARPAGSAAAPPAAVDEASVLDLLQRQQWDQARTALHQLAARDPGSRRIRALVCYARGREAQLDRRVDDARVELQDALELDPDLQVAKTALTELFTRRK